MKALSFFSSINLQKALQSPEDNSTDVTALPVEWRLKIIAKSGLESNRKTFMETIPLVFDSFLRLAQKTDSDAENGVNHLRKT